MAEKKEINSKIHVAFRFHVNFYHSYRGDTPDEYGFGRDMRIIKYILDTLDSHNADGTPVRGTWDIENYYSLEQLMREYCPELIERIKGRADKGLDEIEIMSYNNGLVSAHTEEEFVEMLGRTMTNSGKSGLKDIFGKFAPVVRSQECMMTPSLIKQYQKMGVEAITMFYSCIPFNGFSNFVPLLPTVKRYNPMYYKAPGREERIVLLPCVNPADVYDVFGLAALVKKLRKEQCAMEKPQDLLVTLDMDADDLFWEGYINTALSYEVLKRKTKLWNGGLNIMVNKLKKLPYVEFNTPYDYLKNHQPVGVAEFGQDTMDGSFDGFSPWSDKLENAKLWTGIERSRTVAEYARALSGYAETVEKEIKAMIQNRLLTMSTTHFGLSTPVMCKPRLLKAFDRTKVAICDSEKVLESAKALAPAGDVAALPKRYYRGDGRKSGFIRIKSDRNAIGGKGIKTAFSRNVFGAKELTAVYSGTDYIIPLSSDNLDYKAFGVYADSGAIGNEYVKLAINKDRELELYYDGKRWTDKGSFRTSITYGGERRYAESVTYETELIQGKAAVMTEKGKVPVDSEKGLFAEYVKKYTVAADLPYVYADMDISYPMTDDYGVSKVKRGKLKRGYDTRWTEIIPMEVIPAFKGAPNKPYRVWKHNFMGDLSYYDLNYGLFSENKELDSGNNALTCGFVSYNAGKEALLLAQSVAADNKFAFCTLRLRKDGEADKLFLNPFGCYTGNQLKYAAAYTGISMKTTLKMAEQYMPCATTYRGGRQQFSLMIAPYIGEKPDDKIINDAVMHAYPPYIKSDDSTLQMIDFKEWENYEPLK